MPTNQLQDKFNNREQVQIGCQNKVGWSLIKIQNLTWDLQIGVIREIWLDTMDIRGVPLPKTQLLKKRFV